VASTNEKLRTLFEEMSAALSLLGADSFRASAHARVAREIRGLGEDLRVFVEHDPQTAGKRLAALPGIGQGSARRILEYVETGRIAEHDELLEKVPRGLLDVLAIPGVGPKAAQAMWQELGISSLADLEEQLDSPELASLPRLGKKSIDNIRQAIAWSEKAGDRVPLGIARPIAEDIVGRLREVEGVERIDYAGSLRRGCESIGDIDVLAAGGDPTAVRECFTSLPWVSQVLAQGASKSSVRLQVDSVVLQADLRIVPREAYGAALLYFTGSKDHNVHLRERAIERDLRLNEYGLFAGTEERPQDRGTKPVAAASEAEIYRALDLPYIPPELREDRGEIERRIEVEGLVELGHLRAELHAHTTASDGRLGIEELAAEAKARGLRVLAITDHSQSSVIAGGLSPDEVRRHAERVREANARLAGITLLAGAEVDILPDGSLDYDDATLAELDIVVASPHASLRQGPQVATERLVRAVRHPAVHILGHPTGRKVGRRQGLAPDMSAVFAAAAEAGTALEINANWRRLDLRDVHVRSALEHGCLLAINTDAHRASDFDMLVYGVLTARRGGLPKDSCLNTWTPKRLHTWLQRKRAS
jgi:DNA polymerase (family 10)